MNHYDRVFLVLCGIFIASLIIANSLMFKFFDIPIPVIGAVTVSVGLLPYPVTFLATDLISELYGKARANFLVMVGFGVSLYFLFFIVVGRYVPVTDTMSPEQQVDVQAHYMGVFGAGARAILGSMAAYLLAQFLDVRLFHFFKWLTKGKHLWLRNNGSTLISQFVDSTAVIFIIFWGQDVPHWTLIFSAYAFKLLVALADTPLMYVFVHLFKDIEEETGRRWVQQSGHS